MSGTLLVKPIQAKLTHDTDVFTKMDPYCQILIGNQKVQGQVCKSGGKTPQWDDTITFKRTGEPTMYLELKDKDTISSDEIIGVTQISLNNLPACTANAKWYPVYYEQKPAGEILIEIIWTPDNISQPQPQTQPSVSQQSTQPQVQPSENVAHPAESHSTSAETTHVASTTVAHANVVAGEQGHVEKQEQGHSDYVHPHLVGIKPQKARKRSGSKSSSSSSSDDDEKKEKKKKHHHH